jgi:hypothetical protein
MQHLERNGRGLGIAEFIARGRVRATQMPTTACLLVIDGQEIGWEQFGACS